MQKGTEGRRLVFEILLELERTEQKADVLLHAVLRKHDHLKQQEKAFIKRLTEGCIERRITLDHIIDACAKTKNGRIKMPVRLLLRMGIYQILYMDAVPDAAACNEAVALAAAKGLSGLKGFVNGVLRTVSREKEHLSWPDREQEPVRYLSVYYSMPEWIVERMLAQYGAELTRQMLAAYQEQRPVTVRVCEGADAAALCSAWQQQGIEVLKSPYQPGVYQLENVPGVERLEGFAQGAFTVQDVSSMLAVCAAGIQKGDTVVDVCAAPGGKSMLAAEQCGRDGKVYAFDLTEHKVEQIRENAARLGLAQAEARLQDARETDRTLEGTADVVIADLPCSGLGVLGRKADIRYRLKPEDIISLQALQRQILASAVRYLKPGGTLLYSTCTIDSAENEENRDWIIRELGLKPFSFRKKLPQALDSETAGAGYLQLLCGVPQERPAVDGFFISVYRKAGV
ncbi:MAG: 16S rRNA (cytosine(967)-C(5))-methyltransferase RsmB [Lachnospiraceae bacterium]|nr:16S rRNA (cytosine(967)-C(5))-methyltransferase RsmB [Lachnospiraceae bacterium]